MSPFFQRFSCDGGQGDALNEVVPHSLVSLQFHPAPDGETTVCSEWVDDCTIIIIVKDGQFYSTVAVMLKLRLISDLWKFPFVRSFVSVSHGQIRGQHEDLDRPLSVSSPRSFCKLVIMRVGKCETNGLAGKVIFCGH